MKTALVTGAAGFVGFHVAKRWLEEGWRVIGLDALRDYDDPTPLESLTGYRCTTPLSQGVPEFVRWYRHYFSV